MNLLKALEILSERLITTNEFEFVAYGESFPEDRFSPKDFSEALSYIREFSHQLDRLGKVRSHKYHEALKLVQEMLTIEAENSLSYSNTQKDVLEKTTTMQPF